MINRAVGTYSWSLKMSTYFGKYPLYNRRIGMRECKKIKPLKKGLYALKYIMG